MSECKKTVTTVVSHLPRTVLPGIEICLEFILDTEHFKISVIMSYLYTDKPYQKPNFLEPYS